MIRNSSVEPFWALQDYLQVKPHGEPPTNRQYLNEVFCCYVCIKDIIFGTL
jgi:hypothetical protein